MRRFRLLMFATLAGACALAVLLVAAAMQPQPSGLVLHRVPVTAASADGRTVDLRVDVAAHSSEEATRTARQSVLSLGFEPLPGPGGKAAWQPWPWLWEPSEIPVPVAYNPSGAPPTVGPDSVVAALHAWSNAPGSAFRYRYAGITNNRASILDSGPDGENVVSWAPLDCSQSCALGITSKASGHEVDLLLNNNPAAADLLGVGTTVDWRTVILHELGHMAGLEHSCPAPFGPCTAAEADAVMYFQYRGILRKLATDDVAGLGALYPIGLPLPTASPPAPGASAPPTPYPEFPVVLEKGWNLVLLPPGPAAAIPEGLSCVRAIYTQTDGEWLSFLPGLPQALQTLTTLREHEGYWVLAGSSCARFF